LGGFLVDSAQKQETAEMFPQFHAAAKGRKTKRERRPQHHNFYGGNQFQNENSEQNREFAVGFVEGY